MVEEKKPVKNGEKSDKAILSILNTTYKGPTWPWWGPVDEPIKRINIGKPIKRNSEHIKKNKQQ